MPGINSSFGRLVKRERNRQGLSVQQLAKKAMLARETVRCIEIPIPPYNVTLHTAKKIAHGLGVPLWKLIKECS